MEGTGSYGAELRQQADDAGFQVTEAPVPNQRLGRYAGKSDALDAARAARAALSIPLDRLREPRSGQHHMALRVLTIARRSMTRDRTAAINALTALVRVVDLGLEARKPLTLTQINTIAGWREREEEFGIQTCRREATRHAGRVRSEAAFASLAGTCPVPASSGSKTRFRLNRGGDRQLNKAIYTIALIRMNLDPQTREYVARRISQGRTKKEAIRSLKRYITRQIYRQLNSANVINGTTGAVPGTA